MIKGRLESHGCSLAPCPWRPTSAQSAAENRSRSRVPNDGHEMEASTIGTACLFTSFYIVIFFPTFRKFLEGKFVANRIMAGIWVESLALDPDGKDGTKEKFRGRNGEQGS